jgi:hypothetical protein
MLPPPTEEKKVKEERPSDPHRYVIQLTEPERRAVYLFSMLRRPGTGLRRFMAIIVGGAALMMGAQQSGMAQIFAVIVALACGWIALRPFLMARILSKQGGPEIVVEVGEPGVTLRRDGKSATFAWSRITAQGRGPGFYWYEVQGAALAAIPDRLVTDRPGLEKLLERAGSSGESK